MGIIFLDKKAGITSFDALRDIKKELKTGKVGHTGTLDKFAQGLLIVLTEKSLKLTPWFMHCDKQYIGKICFGKETDTLDPEGAVIAEAPLPTQEQVEAVLPQFTGEIMQTPPAYSALHINGQRAHELARAGKAPLMKARPVTIYKLELNSWDPPFAEISVHCSSGTYIRSLARDIALAAGSRGHLVELTRTAIAGFCLGSGELGVGSGGKRADNKQQIPLPTPYSPLPINKDVIEKLGLSCLDISSAEAQYIRHGKPLDHLSVLRASAPPREAIALFHNQHLISIIQKTNQKWQYGVVFT